jgi:hypothetical protein
MSIKTKSISECSENYEKLINNLVIEENDIIFKTSNKDIITIDLDYYSIKMFRDVTDSTLNEICLLKDKLNNYIKRHEQIYPMGTVAYFKEWSGENFYDFSTDEILLKIDKIKLKLTERLDNIDKNISNFKSWTPTITLNSMNIKGGISDSSWILSSDGIYIDLEYNNVDKIITKIVGEYSDIDCGSSALYKVNGLLRIYLYSKDKSPEQLLYQAKVYNWQIKWFGI